MRCVCCGEGGRVSEREEGVCERARERNVEFVSKKYFQEGGVCECV